jgi:hypothetical protein
MSTRSKFETKLFCWRMNLVSSDERGNQFVPSTFFFFFYLCAAFHEVSTQSRPEPWTARWGSFAIQHPSLVSKSQESSVNWGRGTRCWHFEDNSGLRCAKNRAGVGFSGLVDTDKTHEKPKIFCPIFFPPRNRTNRFKNDITYFCQIHSVLTRISLSIIPRRLWPPIFFFTFFPCRSSKVRSPFLVD